AASSRLRTPSTSAGLAKRSSVTVPPVKSRAKLKPLNTIEPMPMNMIAAAIASDIQRRRMKSIWLSYGNTLKGFMTAIRYSCEPLDGQRLELATTAVDQRRDAARHRHRGVHRGHDAGDQRHREALDRAGAECEQRHARQQCGEVGIGNRAGGLLVTAGDRCLGWYPGAQFFAYSFIDQHVGVDRHANGQRDTGKAGQG